jgi:hypothetical protein
MPMAIPCFFFARPSLVQRRHRDQQATTTVGPWTQRRTRTQPQEHRTYQHDAKSAFLRQKAATPCNTIALFFGRNPEATENVGKSSHKTESTQQLTRSCGAFCAQKKGLAAGRGQVPAKRLLANKGDREWAVTTRG